MLRIFEDIALGAAFLGAGGGGDPAAMVLQARHAIEVGRPVKVLDVSDLVDDQLIAPCAWVGAPTVCDEKIPNGKELVLGIRKLEEVLGKSVAAVFSMEIGGANGIAPIVTAATLGLPIVDCDGMGRAFPESQMVTFNIYGQDACPAVVTDCNGNTIVLHTISNLEEERFARSLSVAMGATCHVVDYPCNGHQVKQHAVRQTLSVSRGIGKSIRGARSNSADPFEALFTYLRGAIGYRRAGTIFDGKIVDIDRNTEGGFSVGEIMIEAFGAGTDCLTVRFQNENLIARKGNQVLGLVPDIISVLDRETAEAITTERLRYGQRVRVVGTSVPEILRTPKALEVLGPKVFGIEEPYVPIEDLNDWD